MFELNKLYNTESKEIREIAQLIYHKNGNEEGLSGDDVSEILKILVDIEESSFELVDEIQKNAYEEGVKDTEKKFGDVEERVKKAEEHGYDKGFEDGYEDGANFKDRLDSIT